MPHRWGTGPVFAYEWKLVSRRWQMYATRAGFIAVLLGALALVWWKCMDENQWRLTLRAQAEVGEWFFYAIVGTQLSLILLAAPAATAGAVCLDKARGSLLLLLTTDLSDAELVLGKLAARFVPTLGLVLGSLPVLFVCVLLGGIDPEALLGAYLVTLAVGVVGSALAFTFSVWGSRPHEVLLSTYAVWVAVLLANPVWWLIDHYTGAGSAPAWFASLNVFWMAFAPYMSPGAVDLAGQALYLAAGLALSAGLVVVAVRHLRRVTVRHAGRRAAPRRGWFGDGRRRGSRWWQGPSLDRNPVLWREWRRKRPTRWCRAVWGVYTVLAVLFSLVAVLEGLLGSGTMGFELAMFVNAIQVGIGLGFLSVMSVTALAEERAHGSLDLLLTTPLPTRTIVLGKWWGAFRTVPRLVVLPTLVCTALLGETGRWSMVLLLVGALFMYGAALTSVGLALAAWVSRLGRAIAVGLGAYVFLSGAWFFFVVLLFNNREVGLGLASATPWFGTAVLTAAGCENAFPDHELAMIQTWNLAWLLAYAVLAAVLLLLTLATFNRCVGRVSGWPQPFPRRRPA